MYQTLTDEELDFIEDIHFSTCAAEVLFSNVDNMTLMKEDEMIYIRPSQIPLLSHEYILDDDPEYNHDRDKNRKNFSLRKGAGDVYALGGRNFGKTAISQKVDLLLRLFLCENQRIAFSSYDFIHIKGVLEEIIPPLRHHPILSLFIISGAGGIVRSPDYRFATKNGNTLVSINMNIVGKEPGKTFVQKHVHVLYIDEASMETEEVYKLRRDSVSEIGCIFRLSGMTNFTRYTPCGRIFYDREKKCQIINHPQYVNPNWNDKSKEQAIKDFSGESSMGFRVFIKGEIVEDGVSVFDMERVKKCYDDRKKVKYFEVNKETFKDFTYDIFVEKPKNAELTYICADIGETAPTEIAILFKIGEKYRYFYNITLFNLTHLEQVEVFKWLGEQLSANYIGLDVTDGMGRAIFRSLELVIPRENLVWCHFNEKLPVDFEKNDNTGEVLFKDGKPVYKEEYVSEWSIKHMKDLFYSEHMSIPMDYKLDEQLNSVQEIRSSTKGQIHTRKIYKCICQTGDHLFQAFQVFSIAHWLTEFLNSKSIVRKSHYKGI